MEQIETQASDLRFLAQAPAPLSDSTSVSYGTPRHPSPPASASAAGGDVLAPHAHKRQADEAAGQRQTRSKRNRYISIACNECKRRKIKCNGEKPCQRCGNLNLACLYAPNCCSSNFKDSDEFHNVTSQLSRLQDEVKWLSQTVQALQADTSTLAQNVAFLQRPDLPSHASSGAFRGPTSMAFSLDVAKNTIANMGYCGINEPDEQDQAVSESPMPMGGVPVDPLCEFDKDKIVRLCQFHEDEIGVMYPVLNIHTVIAHAKNMAPYLESARSQHRSLEAIDDVKTLQLKMAMCCALVTEQHGHSDKAIRLYESMEAVVNRKLMADVSDVANLPLLCLLAGYRFLSSDEVLGWRVMGQVVRLCIELGIHQKRGLVAIQDEAERRTALTSFWLAYVLDRRWSFATGLPFALQDEEIDPELPFPEDYPFLVAMITYSRLGAKVWRQVSHLGPVLARELRHDEIEKLDHEILHWYETVPEDVKVRTWGKEKQTRPTSSYNLQRLRIWTYLRFNQIRIWLYTPILHSATSIQVNPQQAQRVVDLAKDTIQYIDHLNSTTNLYRKARMFYHQFLTSAIAVVFLASVHAPVRFSVVCREEFYVALDLVKDLSAKSWISKRLWRTIKSLKDVAPWFGLDPDDDSQLPAAMGIAGIDQSHIHANHVAPTAPTQFSHATIAPPPQQRPEGQLRQNGKLLQNELSKIFEGYVGLNGFQFGTSDEQLSPPLHPSSSDSGGTIFAADGTVFPHLKDMF